jgi:3-phenylpropionate/trans-cinnamate dioxygenase alpha subunit
MASLGPIQAPALSELVDWESGLISGRIFADDWIYEVELERLFMRSWLFLAHETQIPEYGDFISTYMGADPILVVRQRDGSVKAFLNACRHRGMGICRADGGNAKTFVCPFHGWTYDASGSLRTVPNLDSGYQHELDRSKWGLVRVPRVETYKGLIFGCFDPDAVPLIDYLGDMAWYLDCLLDRREGGTEVIGGVHKMRINGNWKLAAEQFAGDTYHSGTTHASVPHAWSNDEEMITFRDAMDHPGRQYSSPNGHAVAGFLLNAGHPMSSAVSVVSADQQLVIDYFKSTHEEMLNRLGKQRADAPAHGAALIFPNFSYLAMVMGSSSIGVMHPKGPNQFEFWRWAIVDRAAPADVKAAMVRCLHVWPFGLADADDGENWGGIQATLGGPIGRNQMFNYQMGIGREEVHPDFPGCTTPTRTSEMPQRQFYGRWLELMDSR